MVLLYDRTSTQVLVNQARKELFTQKGRTIDGLPPTQAALIEHTKRAVYQAVHCWGQLMVAAPELPSPGDWGGRGMTQVDGKCTGPLYRKQPRPVADFCAAAAKRVVRDSANVPRQHSSAPPFAFVVDYVR